MVLLQVDEERADELIDALSKRAFVQVVKLDREARRGLGTCPVCERRFGKETAVTVNEAMFWAIDAIVSRMRQTGAKSIIIVGSENEIATSNLHEIEKKRAVVCSTEVLIQALRFKLLSEFTDGRQKTFYPTQACLDFFSGVKPLSPARIIIQDSKVIERSGHMVVEDVKFKDQIIRDRMLRDIKHKINGLSERVKTFVRTGQIPLI